MSYRGNRPGESRSLSILANVANATFIPIPAGGSRRKFLRLPRRFSPRISAGVRNGLSIRRFGHAPSIRSFIIRRLIYRHAANPL